MTRFDPQEAERLAYALWPEEFERVPMTRLAKETKAAAAMLRAAIERVQELDKALRDVLDNFGADRD